jgi:hypothetical protein
MYLVIVDSNHLDLSRNEYPALTSGNPQTFKHCVLAESDACSTPALSHRPVELAAKNGQVDFKFLMMRFIGRSTGM